MIRFHNLYSLGFAAGILLSAGCMTTPAQTQKMIEEHPEILISAIEKNPEKFVEAFQKASFQVRQKMAAGNRPAANAACAAGDSAPPGAAKFNAYDAKRIDEELNNPLLPEIPGNRVWGKKEAPITIVEYSDFQCPYCAKGYLITENLLKKYEGKVRFVYKNLPLPMHPFAMAAAKRLAAITLQSSEKAEKYYGMIFSNQGRLKAEGEKFLDEVIQKVGADTSRVKTDLESESVKKMIEADMSEAQKFNFRGTPVFVVAGVTVRGAVSPDTFDRIIDRKLALLSGTSNEKSDTGDKK